MTAEEALMLTGKLLARYPSSRTDKVVLATWTEELMERFGGNAWGEVEQYMKAYCRANPKTYAPSVDELCTWMREAIERDRKPTALPEPRLPVEEFKARMAELRSALSNGSGPIARDWKMRQAGDT